MKNWCVFKISCLKVIAVFRRCNVHTVNTNLLLLIYMSVMHVQNQNIAAFICRKHYFHHKICISYNISTTILICPRNLNLNVKRLDYS